jgi:hypothetical protein
MIFFTGSFETVIVVKAFGAGLRKHIYGNVKDLMVVVVVVVVLCGSILTHLWLRPNK